MNEDFEKEVGMMASGSDLIKYVTERIVEYMDTPREQRKDRSGDKRNKEPWSYRWFGMLPASMRMWLPTKKEKDRPPSDNR